MMISCMQQGQLSMISCHMKQGQLSELLRQEYGIATQFAIKTYSSRP